MPLSVQRGVSLIELMIASLLGMAVIGAAGSLFLSSSESYRQHDRLTRLQDELNFAMLRLEQELEMAGYWGQLHDPSRIQRHASLVVGGDCGAAGAANGDWAFGDLTALVVTDNASPATAHTNHQCLEAADIRAGSDIIAIKRVLGRAAGTDTDLTRMTTGQVYLRAGNLSLRNGSPSGLLYVHGAAVGRTVSAPYQNWEYLAAVYYVQDYSVSPTESPREPSLCRKVLRSGGASPVFERECLASGVENMQIEVGIDTDEDGAANHFVSEPIASDLTRAVSVRLYVLARSLQPDASYTNKKTYQIGNADEQTFTGAAAHYYRKTFSSEIVLRNPRSMQGVPFQ